MNKERLDSLAKEFSGHERKVIKQLNDIVYDENLIDLFVDMLKYQSRMTEPIFLEYFKEWSKLTYTEWLSILEKMTGLIRTYPSGFENLIFLFYRIVEIDLLTPFANSNVIEEKLKKLWLRDYLDFYSRFYISDKELAEKLKSFDLGKSDVKKLREKLCIEGAIIAEKIVKIDSEESEIGFTYSSINWSWKNQLFSF